jgi:probable phosphoglycerate mutase
MRAPRQFPQFRYSVPEGATEILLVRHGESRAYIEGEPVESVDGQDDPPLTERGHLQAEAVADRLARRRVDAIYVSSLQRTQETAAPLAARTGLTPVVDPDLREVFLGSWEGGAYRQKVADRDPVALRIREEERWDVIPGAESPEVLTARLVGAIDRIVAAHPDGRVVAFTQPAHGRSPSSG